MKLVKKITVKTVLGKKVNAATLGDKPEVQLMTVYGQVSKATHGTHDFGDGNLSEYEKFGGNIAAVNTETGEEYRSGNCILPDVAQDLLYGALKKAQGEGDAKDESVSVEFAFGISINKHDSNVGFAYTAEPLIEEAEHDPLQALAARVFPKLENKSEAETAPAPEPKKKAAK